MRTGLRIRLHDRRADRTRRFQQVSALAAPTTPAPATDVDIKSPDHAPNGRRMFLILRDHLRLV
jgi:hypothetical protein